MRSSRPVTEAEWRRLLDLDARVVRGGYSQLPPAEKERRMATLRERDAEILRLWEDRVADSHIADLLGVSEKAVKVARERARAAGYGSGQRAAPPSRRRRPAPDPPPALGLAERELLAAGWDRVRNPRTRRRDWLDTLDRLVTGHRAAGVPTRHLAGAMGVPPWLLNEVLRTHRRRRVMEDSARDGC